LRSVLAEIEAAVAEILPRIKESARLLTSFLGHVRFTACHDGGDGVYMPARLPLPPVGSISTQRGKHPGNIAQVRKAHRCRRSTVVTAAWGGSVRQEHLLRIA